MWDLGSRAVLVSISVLSCCAFLYNAWGAILAVTILLFLVVYACYFLLTNDSLFSARAYLLFDFLQEATHEPRVALARASSRLAENTRELWIGVKRFFERFPPRMERRRRSAYQLSREPCPATGSSPGFDLIEQLSPIPRNSYKSLGSDEENRYYRERSRAYSFDSEFGKHTSTPVGRRRREEVRNGDIGGFSRQTLRRTSPGYSQNHGPLPAENAGYFSPNGSPWSTNVSPKMRAKAGGVKTVQTVAGPLLASTRYNIDPKVFADVTSPGLTMRLTKYATEANNKLTHQPQYGTGQFPKVNLHASSVPLINAKSAKMRVPVTVRVAPPDIAKYSPPERQKILSNLCHTENKSPSSVVQVLRDISLKRHASREDVTSELVKKQRTDGIFNEEVESIDETKQKRSRDESSRSEEDVSPQNKSARPAKRTKTPSCYDILNSLSSSIHVHTTGVKRKAVDFSRSGTPDFEKHFKSLDSAQNSSSQDLSQTPTVNTNQTRQDLNEKHPRNSDVLNPLNKIREPLIVKGILKTNNQDAVSDLNREVIRANNATEKPIKNREEKSTTAKSVKLTDKLFMKAEPQRNERLRSLAEEQVNVKAKFTTDDVEEIKKEDIVNMRQTSMKARLKSMFDAISGKASSINPDVVIQAEEVNATTPVTCATTCATLNSLTTTTTINTTPISTSAIAPTLSAPEPNTRPSQDTTSNVVTTSGSPLNPETPFANTSETKTQNTVSTSEPNKPAASSGSGSTTSLLASPSSSTTNASTTPIFSFPKPSTNVPASTSANASFTFGATSPSNTITSAAISTAAFSTSNIFGNTNVTSSSTVTVNPAKSETSTAPTITSSQSAITTQPSMFTFGASTTAASMSTNVSSSVSAFGVITSGQGIGAATSKATTDSSTSSMFKSVTSSSSLNATTNTSTPTTSLFSFGATTSATAQPQKSEIFAFGGSGNNTQSTSAFGNPSTQAATLSTITTIANYSFTPSTAVNPTTVNANTTSTAFGVPSTSSTFSFGTPTSSAAANKPLFSFGTNTSSTSGTTGTSSSTFEAVSNTTPAFGTPATTSAPQFGAGTPVFGNTSTTSIFGTTNTNPVFGGTSTSGTVSAFGTPKTTSTSIFGTNISTSSGGITNTPSFSTTNNNENPTTSTSVFGTTSNIFGDAKPPSFGTTSNIFGSGSTPMFGAQQTTSTPAFGVNTVSTTPAFGTTNTTTPAFGAQNPTTQAFGGTTPMFGSENTPSSSIFGSATSGGFGSVPSAFGGQNNNLAFGNNASGFGDNKTSPFGTQAATTPAFGTPNSSAPAFGPNNTNNLFSFGANQKPAQTTTFSFGGNTSNNNAPAAGTAPFQFGASTSKPASTGFNFSAPSTMPSINFGTSGTPTFNAPTTGMFSIGSGSTAPRSKSTRSRKPR